MSLVPAPVKPTVEFAVVESLDIRVGARPNNAQRAPTRSVFAFFRHAPTHDRGGRRRPRLEKLLRLTVSFGDHRRQILAGMKQERANPAELIGRQALFVVNLPPKRMAGLASEGMLFDIGYADGLTPALAIPERPLPDGARAG